MSSEWILKFVAVYLCRPVFPHGSLISCGSHIVKYLSAPKNGLKQKSVTELLKRSDDDRIIAGGGEAVVAH